MAKRDRQEWNGKPAGALLPALIPGGGLQQENNLPNTRKEGEKTTGEEELKDRE